MTSGKRDRRRNAEGACGARRCRRSRECRRPSGGPLTVSRSSKQSGDHKEANKPDSVHRPKTAPIIRLSDLPGTLSSREAGTARAAPRVPYLILLQRGFALRRRFRVRPVVSYTAFSPLPGANAGRSVFCGTFRRRRSGGASPALTAGPLALRSPDFPPLPRQERPVALLAAAAKRRPYPTKKAPPLRACLH